MDEQIIVKLPPSVSDDDSFKLEEMLSSVLFQLGLDLEVKIEWQ